MIYFEDNCNFLLLKIVIVSPMFFTFKIQKNNINSSDFENSSKKCYILLGTLVIPKNKHCSDKLRPFVF